MAMILIMSNIITGIVIGAVAILGYQYVAEGYGLHPAICVGVAIACTVLNLVGSGVTVNVKPRKSSTLN